MTEEPKIKTGNEPNVYGSAKALIGLLMIFPLMAIEGSIIILLVGAKSPLKREDIIFRAIVIFTVCILLLICGIIKYRKLQRKEKRWYLKMKLWRILHPQLRKNWTR